MSGEREHVAPMRISDAGLALIKRFEGFSSEVYTCSGGRKTIGYGHVIRKDDEPHHPSTQRRGRGTAARGLPKSQRLRCSDRYACRSRRINSMRW